MRRVFLKKLGLLISVISLLFIALSYALGVNQGLNTRITYGFQHDAWSMSVAISRLVYSLHEGYIGYREVDRVAAEILAPDGVHNVTSIPFLSDRDSIEEAINAGISIDPSSLPVFTPSLDGFHTLLAEDVGLADFYTLAFAFFGFEADAMYNFFFLVFALSAIVFIAEYLRRPGALATLLLLCATFSMFFFSSIFENPLMPSVNANRFMSVLSFIPLLHVLWQLKSVGSISRKTLALLIVQGLIFAFAVSIRRTS